MSFLTDLRFALRTLSKSPAFTATAIITLGLGIGANTAIFSVVNAVLLQPLPYPKADQLVEIKETSPTYSLMSTSFPSYLDWRANQKSFVEMSAYRNNNFNLTGATEPERVAGAFVTASYFRVLGLPLKMGRGFEDRDDQTGGQNGVVISEHFWQSHFSGDRAILGHRLVLNDISYEIIGVAPATIATPENREIFVPFGFYANRPPLTERSNHPALWSIGRLKDGVSIDQAKVDLGLICRNLEKLYPATNTNVSAILSPLLEESVGEYRTSLLLLLAVVGCVLLIACANVANLMLGRSILRRKEIALRAALGASRGRLIAQLLTESVILALGGGLLGLLLGVWSTDLIGALGPTNTSRFREVHLNGLVVLFTAMVSFGTGILFGLVPALKLSRADLANSLKEAGGRGGTAGPDRQTSQALLVVSQVAIACTLLVGAGLLIQSFQALHQVPLGFDPHHLFTAQITVAGKKYHNGPGEPAKDAELANFYHELLVKVQEIPGVRMAGLATVVPFDGAFWETDFGITGRPDPKPGEEPAGQIAAVSPDYFRTMGIELVRGRTFTEDDSFGGQRVVIIDESFANKFFPNEDPVGRSIHDNVEDKPKTQFTIVGVVRTIRYQKLEKPPTYIQFYKPIAQNPELIMKFVLRMENDNPALLNDVRHAVQSVDPNLPVFAAQTMDEMVWNSLRMQHLSVVLVGLFSLLALILAAVGIYGVLAYSVVQRTREIGIRVALGAPRQNIFRLIVGRGMAMVGTGLAVGLLLAMALAQLLGAFLFGIGAVDPATMVSVILVLALTAFLACWLPANRAVRIDPMVALREE